MKGPGKDGDQRHTRPWGALQLEAQHRHWFHLHAILRRVGEELGAAVNQLSPQLCVGGCSHQKGHLYGEPRGAWGSNKADR